MANQESSNSQWIDDRLQDVDRELIDSSERMHRFFVSAFSAGDIALPLPAFDHATSDADILQVMQRRKFGAAGICRDGLACEYLLKPDGDVPPTRQQLQPAQVVQADTSLADVVVKLNESTPLFVSSFGNVSGVIHRECMHKPPGRMWLFGIITLLEMRASIGVEILYPNDSWRELVSPGRIEKALDLQSERAQLGQACALVDCLQLNDKTDLLGRSEKCVALFGMASRRQFKAAIKDMVSLRNNLAHAHDFIPQNWPVVVTLAETLEERLLAPKLKGLLD